MTSDKHLIYQPLFRSKKLTTRLPNQPLIVHSAIRLDMTNFLSPSVSEPRHIGGVFRQDDVERRPWRKRSGQGGLRL
jgi:hypothetical protein